MRASIGTDLGGNKFHVVMILCNCIIWLHDPQVGKTALSFSGNIFSNFIFILTPVFICAGLMDVWIEREKIIQIMEANSGIKGIGLAVLSGMITAVPLYALPPITGVLLKKGSRISNVLLFLCASVSIRIPLLLFEISSLGVSRFSILIRLLAYEI